MSRLLIAALALFPAMAAAQGYEGAVVDLQYQKYDDGDGFELDRIEGTLDASWQLGRIGVQAGLVLGKEIDSSDDIDFQQYNGLALHLTTDVNDSVRLGAMIAADDNADGIYLYAAEALYLSGPLKLEGRIGDSFDNDNDYALAEVKGSYAIGDAFSVKAGMHYSDYGDDGYYRVFSLGAGYTVSPGTEVYAGVGTHANDLGAGSPTLNGSLVNLGVRFDLGGDGSDKVFSYQPLN
jgi:predicted porin